jgi:hypothetical protein
MKNGLGAARGQRFRKGPCASYPTRQFSPLCYRADAQSKNARRMRRIRTGARVSPFAGGAEDHDATGEQWMHPASRLGFVPGNKDDAVSPLGYLIDESYTL